MNIKAFTLKALSATLLSAAAMSAHAVPFAPNVVEAGLVTPLSPFDIQTVLDTGAFYDIYKFSLLENSSSTYTVIDLPIGPVGSPVYKVLFTAGALFSNADTVLFSSDDSKVADLVATASGNKLSFVAGPLAAGNYYLSVVGATAGSAGGIYTGSITANPPLAPVPEPESYAMLLAGLGVMGAIAIRRNKRKQD